MKRPKIKTFTPIMAVAAVFGLAASVAQAQTPVFQYAFPSSWNGTGTTVTDLSAAGNNGATYGTLALSANLPAGGTGQSIDTSGNGGIVTTASSLLSNGTVITHGGFSYSCSFMWNGAANTGFAQQKLIDYAGTESLQLNHVSGSSASLEMVFGDDVGAETSVVSTPISANTWYNVVLTFGNVSPGVGSDVDGTADLYLNGSLVSSGSAVKGTYGDSLARGIGIGMLAYRGGPYVHFAGDIYDPSVSLGVVAVPEPTALALGALGGLALLGFRRRKA